LNALKGTANGLHKALQDFPIETLGMPQLAQDARRDLDKLSRGIDSIASALQSDLAAERRAATAGPAAVAAPDNAGAPWKLVKQYEGGFADFGFAANHTIHLVRCRNGTEHKLYRDAKGKWGSLGLGGNNSAPSFELAAGQKCG
jgi:hypothetical protein